LGKTDISSIDTDVVARSEALLNEALLVTCDLGAKYMGGVLYSALHKYDSPTVVSFCSWCLIRKLENAMSSAGSQLEN
jgi:hypothetical protein